MCKGETTETLAEWDARMEATHTRPPKGTRPTWVVDGHGHLLDPDKDVLDDVALAMLARLRSE